MLNIEKIVTPKEIVADITKNIDSLVFPIKELSENMTNVEEKNANNTKKSESKTIVTRYSRYIENIPLLFSKMDARGGVSYQFELDYENKCARVGIAVCSEKKRFNKKIGREIALERLKNDPIIFPFVTPSDTGLVKSFWTAVSEGKAKISEKNAKIIRAVDIGRLILNGIY